MPRPKRTNKPLPQLQHRASKEHNQMMTDDELQQIRARYADMSQYALMEWGAANKFIDRAVEDIPALLAEVERLRKMVADLQDEKQDLEDEAISSVIERMSGNY